MGIGNSFCVNLSYQREKRGNRQEAESRRKKETGKWGLEIVSA